MNPYREQGQAGFILRFALSMAVLTVVYSHLEPVFGYTHLYLFSLSVAALLDLVGVPTVLALYLDQGFCELQMKRNVFLVEYECTGVFPLCIYLGTVGVYSATLAAKVLGVVLGVPAFFAYAVLCLLGLGPIGHLAPSWLEFFHVYLMVALNLGFLFFSVVLLGESPDALDAEKRVNSLAAERPLSFFALFALATLLLLPLWNELGAWYMTAVVVLVNNASAWTGLPPEFQFGALPGQEAINPGIAAGMALFIATPKRSVCWKLAWIIALVAFLWPWQSLLMLFQIYIASAHFFAQLPWPQQLDYDAPIVLSLRPESLFATFVESGHYWTSLLCNVLIWLVATGRR